MTRYITLYNEDLLFPILWLIDQQEENKLLDAFQTIRMKKSNFEGIIINTKNVTPINNSLKHILMKHLLGEEFESGLKEDIYLYSHFLTESKDKSLKVYNTRIIIDRLFQIQIAYDTSSGDTVFSNTYSLDKLLGHHRYSTKTPKGLERIKYLLKQI